MVVRVLRIGCVIFALGLLGSDTSAQAAPSWEQSIDKAVSAVVAIRVNSTRDFDMGSARSSVGTGFVVDAERGLILTNRHMVHAGPVVAEAVFLNHEEVPLRAIYRDPVHDFGFYQFDPDDLKHMELVDLDLAPHALRVGMEIRVIGNDSGEKLSILDGTVARVDRNAPNYGGNTYNDFNTFYVQAASNTSGGSSGSPVVDIRGRVVALNAGGKRTAASSFYLPLDRVDVALKRIQNKQPVPRGTLQSVLRFTPFDEVLRLGLDPTTETAVRAAHKDLTGMLVVREVVPEGPSDGKLEAGDVLLRVEENWIVDFVSLEEILDSHVGETISVEVDRGGEGVSLDIEVGDLHHITPDRFLEVGRGVFHPLSYQQARNHRLPVRGVYGATAGYMWGTGGIPSGSIITHIDSIEIHTLDDLENVLSVMPQDHRMRVRFFRVSDATREYETIVRMDWVWFESRLCVRDDVLGKWPCRTMKNASKPVKTAAPNLDPMSSQKGAAKRVGDALVVVEYDIPHPTEGVKDRHFKGVGVVVDREEGLLIVDRDTVPVGLGDMSITFGGVLRVPGRVVFLHPVHNYAIVQYDSEAVGDYPVQAIEFAGKSPKKGDGVVLVGLNSDYETISHKTTIKDKDALFMGRSTTPRFQQTNMEVLSLEDSLPTVGGVLTDKQGRVVALWQSFLNGRTGKRAFYGVSKEYFQYVLRALNAGTLKHTGFLGAEFGEINVTEARDLGLSEARSRSVLKRKSGDRQLLVVAGIMGGTDAAEKLKHADIILEFNGVPVYQMSDVEGLTGEEKVEVTVLRDAKEHKVEVSLIQLEGAGRHPLVSWAGMMLHEPHYEVAYQRGLAPTGVYIAWMWHGSPGIWYGLRPTQRIVQVNDHNISEMADFLRVVSELESGESIRLVIRDLEDTPDVKTLKLDLDYWPTQVFERDDKGYWTRTALSSKSPTKASLP